MIEIMRLTLENITIKDHKIYDPEGNFRGEILYEYVRGSHLYSTNVETSDEDQGGIYIMPNDCITGLGLDYQSEIKDASNDKCIWELGRFLELALSSNPTVLEALFVPDDKVIYEHPIVKEIRSRRDEFVTKKCFAPFGGYAVSQIKKAQGQNKKIHWDIKQMVRKTPMDFCFTFKGQGSQSMQEWLDERGLDQRNCGLVNVPNMPNIYGVYYDWGQHIRLAGITKEYFIDYENYRKDVFIKTMIRFVGDNYSCWDNFEDALESVWEDYSTPLGGYCGIISPEGDSNTIRFSSVAKEDSPICFMSYNGNAYATHCREYKEYEEWKAHRNPARYESNMEGELSGNADMKYDCYLDDETEFLTNNGWKKYDDIKDGDLIGCFNDSHNIEYKPFLSRIEKTYTGEIYKYESPYVKFSVTPNHKLYLSKIHRGPKTNYSTKYDSSTANWELIKTKDFFEGKSSYYHQLQHLNNNKPDNSEFSDDFIKLLGMFLSEGTYLRNSRTKEPTGIRISQTNDHRGVKIMDSIKNIDLKHYVYNYDKFGRGKGDEHVWDTRDKDILNKILECGDSLATEKTIPQYVFTFSKRQFDILLESMIAGDGTHHKVKGHDVYYTTSSDMAKNLHTLLALNGYNSQVYVYDTIKYPGRFMRKDGKTHQTYQVFISKFGEQYHTISKTSHWKVENVNNKRVVCFETEYGTLVTRNGNKIAFHGNCKNMMHCFRLMAMAKEIAEGKGVILDRTGIDRDFLLDVRNRKYGYSELQEKMLKLKDEMDKAIENSTIKEEIDARFVNDMLLKARMEFNK